jgi:hypothetical protein
MTERIPGRLSALIGAIAMMIGCLAITAGAASATEVAYNNLNTVAPTVNGLPNEATFSLDGQNFPVGGLVAFAPTRGHAIKSLTAQLDVFACEHGVYSLENCYTLRNKRFPMEWTASIYEVGPGNTIGTLLTSSTATFKLHYRPTTNVSCPSTPEGKGFGANCDVGGQLNTIAFKHFSPASLPAQAIVTLTSPSADVVNVGLQASYKEFAGGEFVTEPAANAGVPAVGSDPLPEDIYTAGTLNAGGWAGFQPVFEVTVSGH